MLSVSIFFEYLRISTKGFLPVRPFFHYWLQRGYPMIPELSLYAEKSVQSFLEVFLKDISQIYFMSQMIFNNFMSLPCWIRTEIEKLRTHVLHFSLEWYLKKLINLWRIFVVASIKNIVGLFIFPREI